RGRAEGCTRRIVRRAARLPRRDPRASAAQPETDLCPFESASSRRRGSPTPAPTRGARAVDWAVFVAGAGSARGHAWGVSGSVNELLALDGLRRCLAPRHLDAGRGAVPVDALPRRRAVARGASLSRRLSTRPELLLQLLAQPLQLFAQLAQLGEVADLSFVRRTVRGPQ